MLEPHFGYTQTDAYQHWLTRVTRLRYQVLVGTPYVHVSPMEWRIVPDSLRMIARDRGYLEIPPMFQGCLSFQFVPQSLVPRPSFDFPGHTNPGRERWLLNRISGEDDVWISLKHAKLPLRAITSLAESEGLRIAADFSDPTDRILLLSRNPGTLRLPIRPPTGFRRFRLSWLNFVAPAVSFVLCFAGALFSGGDPNENPVTALLLAGVVFLTLPAAFITSIFPRTTRVGWLAREFNGANSVQFLRRTFHVSDDLAAQIAAHHGYVYYLQTPTRAHGPILKYYKRWLI